MAIDREQGWEQRKMKIRVLKLLEWKRVVEVPRFVSDERGNAVLNDI